MPYTIRKLPGKELYRVKIDKTGKIVAYATAQPQNVIKAIEANKNRKK
jgi:hypothetical protein